ncbi:MAG: MFS transporter [Acidimicrobiales bacterium]
MSTLLGLWESSSLELGGNMGFRREGPADAHPLIASAVLAATVDPLDIAFLVMARQISRATGLALGTLAILFVVKVVFSAAAALFLASFAHARSRRWTTSLEGAAVWAAMAAVFALTGSTSSMLAVLLVTGVATTTVRALHPPLIHDAYRPALPGLTVHQIALVAGTFVGAGLVGLLTGVGQYTWRVVFLAISQVAMVGTIVAVLVSNRGSAFPESHERRRRLVTAAAGRGDPEAETEVPLGVFEGITRLVKIRSVVFITIMSGVSGAVLAVAYAFVPRVLVSTRSTGPGEAAVVIMAMALAGAAGIILFSRYAATGDPDVVLTRAAFVLFAGGVCWAAGVVWRTQVAFFPLVVLAFAAGVATLATVTDSLLSVVHPKLRTLASGMRAAAASLGLIVGLLLFGGLGTKLQVWWASALEMVVMGLVGAGTLIAAAQTVGADVEALAGELTEEQEVRAAFRSLPLLACRNVDFAYGQQQVLFGVDFTIREGEMVALLGTNGAGKSTLLRAMSGLGYPTGGSIRLRGADITFVGAERRARLGIVQVLGGRAVFGPLTVVQNLRLFSYSYGAQRAEIDRGIERAFEMFPSLHELRNQPAANLSGGQQQMLALSRAFVLQPQLLLIDELSLGLAPIVVAGLLGAVRQVNEAGTAVVLVEQSVNIALSVVRHAYFMEKGEIRFDGASADLLQRSDLLRSVFLGGAAARSGHDDSGRADASELTKSSA